MNRAAALALLSAAAMTLPGCVVVNKRTTVRAEEPATAAADAPEVRRIERTLDDLHDAASKADGARYFALFAPGAVFLGTDATERWPIDEFRAYAQARFDTGTGWTYTPLRRSVTIAPDGRTAWFDESLINARYGECRGTGALIRTEGRWLITQYNLTVPIPNEMLPGVADAIRAHHSARRDDPANPLHNR